MKPGIVKKPSRAINNENEVNTGPSSAAKAAYSSKSGKTMDGRLKLFYPQLPIENGHHSFVPAKQQHLALPAVIVRRRCRSETTHYEYILNNFRQISEKPKPQNGHTPTINKKVLQESTITNNYYAASNRSHDHIKENMLSNYADKRRVEPEMLDMREIYLNEAHKVKNGYHHHHHQQQQHQYMTNNGNPLNQFYSKQHHNNYDEFSTMSATNGGNPKNLMFDTHRRRMRERSESEPHELYTTHHNLEQLNASRGHDDFSLKRSREVASPPLASKVRTANVFGKETTFTLANGGATAKTINPHHSLLISSHQFNKMTTPRLRKSKSPAVAVNGTSNNNNNNNRRSESPLLRKNSTLSRTNSNSSTNSFIRQSASPTLRKSQIQQQQRQLMLKKRNSEERSSDQSQQDYDSSETEDDDSDDLDDSDDFIGDSDDSDDFDASITDSEDSYKNHVASSSTTTAASPKASIAPTVATESIPGGVVKPMQAAPLASSLFPNVPPYLTFASHFEKGPDMPAAIHKQLKWKLTTITPVVVRTVLANSGFRLLKKTNDWMGIWGKHMKSPCFKTLRHYQKINHLPGSFQIGRKDRVWRNLQTQMSRHGKKEFGFMPRTFIIPQDLKLLRQVWQRYYQRNVKWIIKPPASARGTGIKVVNRWSQIPKRKPMIVQRYIDRPLLINGSKFDLRLYVLVTSMNPLRVYMHTDGLARFASVKYSEKADTLNDRYMHLTNYSINKMSQNYTKNEDASACKGHKWTIKSLWTYLSEQQGVNVDRLWGALRNLVLRTILAGEGPINAMTKLNVGSKYNCYELFGVDVILDSELVPWLLEVNISPSLHSSSPLDLHVKGPLVTAVLNTAMYQIPPKIPLAQQAEILTELGLKKPLCYDKKICVVGLTKEERLKHNQFIQKSMTRDEYLTGILEELTPDDVRCLLLTEDELARSAPLERIFPAPKTHKYLAFTENPRYYNRLLDAWENRYSKKRAEGIELLRGKCEKRIHLQVPPGTTIQKDLNDKPDTASTATTDAATENGFFAAKSVETNHTTSKAIDNNSSSNLNLMKIMENQEPNLLTQNGHNHHHHRDHKHCNSVVSPKSKISKIFIADEIDKTDDEQVHC